MSEIKAIETHYKGYRFRSRLEARWAVFFDYLEISWEYEPEGFKTSAGPYLPDFLLWGDTFAEVKPECVLENGGTPQWLVKMEDVAGGTGFPVVLLAGAPRTRFYEAVYPRGADDMQWEWLDFGASAKKKQAWYLFDGRQTRPPSHMLEDFWYQRAASESARSARFEHGESGARNTGPMALSEILRSASTVR